MGQMTFPNGGLGTLRGLLKSHRRAAETAQSVKGVSHEHEDLSWSLRPTFPKPNKTGTIVHTCHPTAGDGKNGNWASLAISLAKLASPRPVRDPVSKSKVNRKGCLLPSLMTNQA